MKNDFLPSTPAKLANLAKQTIQAARKAQAIEPPHTIGRRYLETLAREFGHPVDDLIDWHKEDLEDLGTHPLEWARPIVRDYLENLETYRDTKAQGKA